MSGRCPLRIACGDTQATADGGSVDDRKGMREDRVGDIAARLKAHARQLDEAATDVQKAVATLRPVWTGPDAAAFARRSTGMVHVASDLAALLWQDVDDMPS